MWLNTHVPFRGISLLNRDSTSGLAEYNATVMELGLHRLSRADSTYMWRVECGEQISRGYVE